MKGQTTTNHTIFHAELGGSYKRGRWALTIWRGLRSPLGSGCAN